ncbi:MAG: TetR/AcrR family transcriptional regulator [Chloroflexi bacterium]|nr:TetR/AcrR family transcriptional regulator [Ardenticatenaceae bacterium]MBL1130473.1 TetR/AcrR family transcriptional regulator [Chloroflexota bacterium]NOG36563.1 TetR/AcrR family transcriptional regulator [Chloroflexota bacterium]GIK57784.1 MAG: TetR family transcriptional regulator [Chloroflexota bacterium]
MPKETFFNLPEEKRQHFLEIALAEFASHDYANASISRIVAQAGIAKGSFYQYFADKAELYRYLLELGAQQKAQFLATPPPEADMDIFAYLAWLAQAGVQFELAHPQLSQIGYRAVKSGDVPSELMQQARASAYTFFAQLVAQGKTQGSIDAQIDEELAAFIFHTIITELGGYLLSRVEENAADRLADGRSFFDSPAADLFNQTIHILQFGMGAR